MDCIFILSNFSCTKISSNWIISILELPDMDDDPDDDPEYRVPADAETGISIFLSFSFPVFVQNSSYKLF